MPAYGNPSRQAPASIQTLLRILGMDDPRAAMPGPPLMTVGPKAIPLDQPMSYLRKVLGETVGDMAEKPGAWVSKQAAMSRSPEAAAVQSWLSPEYADEARAAFQHGPGSFGALNAADDGLRESMNGFDERLVDWLANLFYGKR